MRKAPRQWRLAAWLLDRVYGRLGDPEVESVRLDVARVSHRLRRLIREYPTEHEGPDTSWSAQDEQAAEDLHRGPK